MKSIKRKRKTQSKNKSSSNQILKKNHFKTKDKNVKVEITKTRLKSSLNTQVKTAPKIKKKKVKNGLTPQQAIESALHCLHSSSVPASVPCREKHFQDIFGFVETKLLDGEGGCMYVSGVPGTGKTTTLNEVQKRLNQCEYLPKFGFLTINAVQLGDPKKFYAYFCSLLTGNFYNDKKAFQYLNNRFTNGRKDKEFVILFVDEFDYLRTKNQDILYMLFDWPKQTNSKLIIITIANTMDLPEHSMLKLSSRIAFTRVAFHPYNYEELEKILLSRIGTLVDENIFQLDALRLICRKVAGVSGDARRALDIGRRAVENAIRNKRITVQLTDVADAFQEILNSTKMVAVRSCSLQEQIFLRALVQETRSNGDHECRFIDVYHIHVDICRLQGEYVPSSTELSFIAIRLDQSKIINLEKSNSHLYRKIFLEISPEDIQLALNIDNE